MAGAPGPIKSALKKTSKYGGNSSNVNFTEPTVLETFLEGNEEEDEGLTKKEKIQIMIQKKKASDAKAKTIVYHLIETGVEKSYLLENARFISLTHWEDIVEERKLSRICGWVLCDNKLETIPKQQFRIRNNTVLDISERKSFCSSHCYAVADNFKNQLPISPLWMRDEEVIPQFEILEDQSKELHGINVALNKLQIDDGDDESESSESEDEKKVSKN
ncbi:unnamed protein product [Allacma fusca]|uniref:RNA polymerase II subunit B1 CTD phosphatase RPAP2 homolog n=1 Tax=Allacma fusca TaxID=39272 RepID=A0A8J2PDN9_9HEXA|nr:unnamed protein product [Allacma fusca]